MAVDFSNPFQTPKLDKFEKGLSEREKALPAANFSRANEAKKIAEDEYADVISWLRQKEVQPAFIETIGRDLRSMQKVQFHLDRANFRRALPSELAHIDKQELQELAREVEQASQAIQDWNQAEVQVYKTRYSAKEAALLRKWTDSVLNIFRCERTREKPEYNEDTGWINANKILGNDELNTLFEENNIDQTTAANAVGELSVVATFVTPTLLQRIFDTLLEIFSLGSLVTGTWNQQTVIQNEAAQDFRLLPAEHRELLAQLLGTESSFVLTEAVKKAIELSLRSRANPTRDPEIDAANYAKGLTAAIGMYSEASKLSGPAVETNPPQGGHALGSELASQPAERTNTAPQFAEELSDIASNWNTADDKKPYLTKILQIIRGNDRSSHEQLVLLVRELADPVLAEKIDQLANKYMLTDIDFSQYTRSVAETLVVRHCASVNLRFAEKNVEGISLLKAALRIEKELDTSGNREIYIKDLLTDLSQDKKEAKNQIKDLFLLYSKLVMKKFEHPELAEQYKQAIGPNTQGLFTNVCKVALQDRKALPTIARIVVYMSATSKVDAGETESVPPATASNATSENPTGELD